MRGIDLDLAVCVGSNLKLKPLGTSRHWKITKRKSERIYPSIKKERKKEEY